MSDILFLNINGPDRPGITAAFTRALARHSVNILDIDQAGKPRITYANVLADMVPRLIEEHLIEGNVVEEWAFGRVPLAGIGAPDQQASS